MTLSLYLSRVVGMRILTAWFALALLGVSIDLFRAATNLIELGGAIRLLEYVLLRTPQIMVTLFPVATLIGATTAFLSLNHHSEVVVLRAAGSGIFVILKRLGPLAVILGILYSQVGDRVNSWTAESLALAFPETKKEAPVGSWIWARDGQNVIRARLGSEDGTLLREVIIYEVEDQGHTSARMKADQALYTDGTWVMDGVRRTQKDQIIEDKTWPWETRLTPGSVREIASKSIDVSADDARAALAGTAVSTRSASYYATRIARNYSSLALPFVMLLLAALAGLGSTRGDGRIRLASYALVMGFCYVAFDGMFGSLGESGVIAPLYAALVPTVFFAIAGIWGLMILDE